MRRTLGVGAAAVALLLVPSTPALAHDSAGDQPSASRALQVADSGAAKRMTAVANLQYEPGGEAQRGSDIEFLKVGDREFALAGTLRKGMQIINITDPRNPRVAAVYDCDISQGDIQVWTKGERILASYTADGTFGTTGAASTCAKDLDLGSDASGTVIVELTRPLSHRR